MRPVLRTPPGPGPQPRHDPETATREQQRPPGAVLCHSMPKAARVLAALKRDGWIETRRAGSHRVLVRGERQRVWAYHDGVDLGGPAMARVAKDYGYTLAELRKL